jgi:hypothetical protein
LGPAFWHCQGNIETAEQKTLDFETAYCRVAQTELEIGEKNSQSNLYNEKSQLMNPLGSRTIGSNREKVANLRRALKAVRENSANEFTK